tara:strand:- start:483 stop:638 length:156 start_codon:yes stop_codon:yes gene_type:complete
MSTFTEKHKIAANLLDGPSDLKPQTKTSFVLSQEVSAVVEKPAPKKPKESK